MKTISFHEDILPLKNMLFRIALRLTMNRMDAEDIVQETLIRCWNKRDSWQEIDSIEAFATTICRNLALDSLKKAGRTNPSLDDTVPGKDGKMPYDKASAEKTPLEQAIANENIARLKQLIDQLPEKQKLCMQLRDFEEKSYKEISEILNIPEAQVKVNIFRARQNVKKSIEC